MDTPPNNLRKWSEVTARAHHAPTPEIDVRAAVRRAISATSVRRPTPRESADPSRSPWVQGAFATLTLIAGASGYLGLHAVPELSVALGFGIPF